MFDSAIYLYVTIILLVQMFSTKRICKIATSVSIIAAIVMMVILLNTISFSDIFIIGLQVLYLLQIYLIRKINKV